jgi:hypothetical protein
MVEWYIRIQIDFAHFRVQLKAMLSLTESSEFNIGTVLIVNGELGMQNLLCANRPGPPTATLLQFTIQNCPSRQPRFFDRALRSVKEYYEKVEYIHLNPVRAGHVKRAEER